MDGYLWFIGLIPDKIRRYLLVVTSRGICLVVLSSDNLFIIGKADWRFKVCSLSMVTRVLFGMSHVDVE